MRKWATWCGWWPSLRSDSASRANSIAASRVTCSGGGGGVVAQQVAQVEEVLLNGGALFESDAAPLGDELLGRERGGHGGRSGAIILIRDRRGKVGELGDALLRLPLRLRCAPLRVR